MLISYGGVLDISYMNTVYLVVRNYINYALYEYNVNDQKGFIR